MLWMCVQCILQCTGVPLLHDMAVQQKYRSVLGIQIVFAVATSWEKLSFEAGDRFTLPYQTHIHTHTLALAHIKILFFQREFHREICGALISHAAAQSFDKCLAWYALKRPNDNGYTMNDYRLRWKNVQLAFSEAKAN